MKNRDLIIRDKLQKDKQISDKADKIFNNFKEEFRLENNEGKKVIKISFNKFLTIAASFVIVGFLGISLYAQKLGKPNIISGIQALINNEKSVELSNFIESEIGISFNYPQEWKYVDNNHGSGVIIVGLDENSNTEHNENICFSTTYDLNNERLALREYIEKMEEYKKSKKEGTIVIAEKEGYYFETDEIEYDINKEYQNKKMTICIEANSMIYIMRFSGDKGLYDQYYKTFEEMLKTVRFNNPTYIEENNQTASNNSNIELTNYINSEIGVQFYYPGEWTQKDNNHGSGAVGVWLNKDSNEKHIENVYLWVEDRSSEENYLSPEESVKRYESSTGNDEKGKININGNEGYYINKSGSRTENNTKYENKEKIIYVKANNRMYRIAYSGDKKLYDKYYDAFNEILKTIKFNNPTYVEGNNQTASNNSNIELTNYINSEIGVQFYYPGEWTQKDNNHGSDAVGVWLNKDSNEKHIENVYLWVEDRSSEENYLSPEESVKRYESSTGNDEKGKININGNEGYYINKSGSRTENNTKYENKEKIIYVKANNRMYRIAYSGDKKLYDKYYDAFNEILKTIKFRNPVY